MCIPVVKSRWRVRHWSAPDRMVSTSTLSEDPYNGNTEESSNIGYQASGSDSIQPISMAQSQYVFEDDLNEIISPGNSCSMSCKAVNYLYDSSPLLIYPTTIVEYHKNSEDNMSNSEEIDSQTRSQDTRPIDERLKDDATFYESCTEERNFHPTKPMKFMRDETRANRQRHASCPIFPVNNDNDTSDVIEVHEIDGGPSSDLLPVQSMILMLLLQRRQSSQDISTELNTARRNESTARLTTTTRLESTIRTTTRHNVELRKLISIFPHNYKYEPPNSRNIFNRHILCNSTPSLHYQSLSPSAHDLQVPDVNNEEEDLDRFPLIQSNFKPLAYPKEDPVVDANERTDQTRTLESSNESILNRQTILSIEQSGFELNKYNQPFQDVSSNGPDCREFGIRQAGIPKSESNNKVLKNSKQVVHERNGMDEFKEELELDTKFETINAITNSISLEHQVSNVLSNSLCRHPYLQGYPKNSCSSASQIQYNHERCLKTVSDSTQQKKNLFNHTTSTYSNLASNVNRIGKINKDVLVVPKENTLSIPENHMSNDCQTILPFYHRKKELLQPLKIKDDDSNNVISPESLHKETDTKVGNIVKLSSNEYIPLSGSKQPNVASNNNVKTPSKEPLQSLVTQSCGRAVKCGGNRISKRQMFGLTPIYVSLIMFLITITVPYGEPRILKDPVCNNSVEIRSFKDFQLLQDCRVIEGSLLINIFDDIDDPREAYKDRLIAGNLTFPQLREVTDFLVLYSTKHIKTLSTLFPHLTVIRGNRLIKNFALVIYQMPDMEEVGLIGLTHILNGGVRIQYNPSLCYARNGDSEDDDGSINWSKILKEEYSKAGKIHKKEYLIIEQNNLINQCPKICPANCQYCWNENYCQILKLDICPDDVGGSNRNSVCYKTQNTFENGQLMTCSSECLGGCLTKDDDNRQLKLASTQNECYSCKNFLSPMSSEKFSSHGNHGCWPKCSEGFVSYKDWRCISNQECHEKTYTSNTNAMIEVKEHYKIYDGECIQECPSNTQEAEENGKKTCKKCLNCPKRCTPGGVISSAQDLLKLKDCTEIEDNLIISSLQLSGGDAFKLLEEGLGKIKTIRGSLIISRSAPIVSLAFFKDLEIIRNVHIDDGSSDVNDSQQTRRTNYALELTENENLRVLFPEASRRDNRKNVIIRSQKGENAEPEKGSASIHYNPKLCKKEIEKLLQYSEMKQPQLIDISYGTNGDKAICSEATLGLSVVPFYDTCDVFIENYQEVLANKQIDTRQLLKYEINYREISEEVYKASICNGSTEEGVKCEESKRLSKYEKRDACGESDWKISDHKPSGGKPTVKDGTGDVTIDWVKEQSLLRPLKPFTYYAIYVTTMIVKNVGPGGKNVEGAQSEIQFFRTLEFTPTEPRDIQVLKNEENPTNVEITWREPESPNGIIGYYDVEMTLREIDEERIMQRPFCQKKYQIKKFEIEEEDNETNEKPDPVDDTSGTCSCINCGSDTSDSNNGNLIREKQKISEEREFEDTLIDEVWGMNMYRVEPLENQFGNEPPREKREDLVVSRVKRYIDTESVNKPEDIQTSDIEPSKKDSESNVSTDVQSDGWIMIGTRKVRTRIYRKVDHSALNIAQNRYSLTVDQLRHFGQYDLKIRACHADDPKALSVASVPNYKQQCSEYAKLPIQTYPDKNADNVEKIEAIYDYKSSDLMKIGGKRRDNLTIENAYDKETENKGEPVYITWIPPEDPNLLIVNYNIKMITDANSQDLNTCETAKNFKTSNNKYQLTQPGTYTVHVQACSLAGCGEWSPGISVSVSQKSTAYLLYVILIPVLVVVLVITLLASGFIYVKYKASNASNGFDPNPWYHNIEDVYIVDEWEVERERVEDLGGGQELKTKLGGGAFGVVYSGIFDDPRSGRTQVAVKTVKDNQQCRTFLGEAQVMKNFKTPHVVMLIGVVSQGTPPLVLLEMMKNGSLKEYLHSLRASKKQEERRPTEKEFLQMAIEIADGMAYLSTTKNPNPIVHCDLAARNCLVSDPPIIKIGDFGMAHEVYADYYKKGNPGMMPVRWMAPETLRDGKFSSASDVWSFGVVLWEMVTLAEQPYQGMGNDGAMKYIKNGGTMERPNECPDSIHNLMRTCWRQLPEDRPTFIDICKHLLPHSNQRYQRDSFITSTDGRLAIAEQEQSRDTQFNMQEDSINERTHLTNINTSNYTPSSFTDSPQIQTGTNGNGNSNGNAGGGRVVTDNGMPPSMGFQMHNLTPTGSPVSPSSDDQSATNGNHNEIIPTTSMHSDVNISLVGNDARTNDSFQHNNRVLNRNILNRIRGAMRYLRTNRGQNHNFGEHAGNPKA